MKDIQEYYNFLIKKYKLQGEYNKFLYSMIIALYVRESFFWLILISTQNRIEDKDKLVKIIVTGFVILGIASFLEVIYQKQKTKLLNQLNKVHLDYSINYLLNLDKEKVLNMNMVEQFNYIETVKLGLDNITEKTILLTGISAVTITVLISLRRVNVLLIIGLLSFFNILIYNIQKKNITLEEDLTEENNELINQIRNYIVDSKQKIINNNFNKKHCEQLFKGYVSNSSKLSKIQNSVKSYNSIMIILIILIVICTKYKTSSIIDIFLYLMIIYDLDLFVGYLFELYKNQKSYTKINLQLGLLFSENVKKKKSIEEVEIKSLVIEKLINEKDPILYLTKPVNILKGETILCNGNSGEGKTTFFKYLKNIKQPKEVSLIVNDDQKFDSFEVISNKVYFTIQSNKPAFDQYLYDYITNFSKNVDKEKVKECLKAVVLDHLFSGDENKMVIIESLSGGERIRLALAQTLYQISKSGCDIILFDEIDSNLDITTGKMILNNIISMFQDKIKFFIIHSNELKDLINKQLAFKDGNITPNF